MSQEKLEWGAKVIDYLCQDLRTKLPEMNGFSFRNLKIMQAFAAAYLEEEFVQKVAAQLPRFHLCVIITWIKDTEERIFYLKKTIEHGWNRNILIHQIESGLHLREGTSPRILLSLYPRKINGISNINPGNPRREGCTIEDLMKEEGLF